MWKSLIAIILFSSSVLATETSLNVHLVLMTKVYPANGSRPLTHPDIRFDGQLHLKPMGADSRISTADLTLTDSADADVEVYCRVQVKAYPAEISMTNCPRGTLVYELTMTQTAQIPSAAEAYNIAFGSTAFCEGGPVHLELKGNANIRGRIFEIYAHAL